MSATVLATWTPPSYLAANKAVPFETYCKENSKLGQYRGFSCVVQLGGHAVRSNERRDFGITKFSSLHMLNFSLRSATRPMFPSLPRSVVESHLSIGSDGRTEAETGRDRQIEGRLRKFWFFFLLFFCLDLIVYNSDCAPFQLAGHESCGDARPPNRSRTPRNALQHHRCLGRPGRPSR